MTATGVAPYRDDFDAFAAEVARLHLYSRQRDLVRVVREHERVAVPGGNAVGKSVAAAFVILHWLAGGRARSSWHERDGGAASTRVLWREVRRQFKQARDFFDGAAVTETEIRLGRDWFAVGFSTDTPEAMQGIHAERVLVVVDEASGVTRTSSTPSRDLLARRRSRSC